MHDASDGLRSRGDDGGDDHHADVAVRQQGDAAGRGCDVEQWRDVVRSEIEPTELDRGGQAAFDEHVADYFEGWRSALARGGRVGWAAHSGGGDSGDEFHFRFRNDGGTG